MHSLPNSDETVIQLDAYLKETVVEHRRHCHLKYSGITEGVIAVNAVNCSVTRTQRPLHSCSEKKALVSHCG